MNLMHKALSEYGVKEIVGSNDNLRIIKYFNEIGFDGSKLKDETAWCSAFANWVAKTAGYEHSGKLNARSWLKVGASTNTPSIGDVVVLWREDPNSWKGHVGFFVKETQNFVYVLGGNQGNMVCIKAYPKSRVLDYKKLARIQ